MNNGNNNKVPRHLNIFRIMQSMLNSYVFSAAAL